MTLPTDSPEEVGGDKELLRRLQEAPEKAVEAASKQVAHWTVDDDAADRRQSKAGVRRTLHSIRKRFFWFLFFLVCLVLLVLAGGYLYLLWLWLGTVLWGTKLHDPVALKSFIDSVLWSVLIIFATLFLEGTFKDKDD